MSSFECLAFVYICSQADTRTGIWKGSAGALVGELGFKPRTARDLLERLQHGDYIRRFAIAGSHVCYPILVHKFPITQGEHNGEQLDALNSLSATELRYLPKETCEHDGEVHGEVHASQRRIENREKRKEKKNPAAKPAPPADPRQKSVFDSCYEAYRLKFGMAPAWAGREARTLQGFLREHHSIPTEEIVCRFGHLLGSTDRYHAEKHGSLLHLLSNFDTFADGPILAVPLKGGSHAKPAIGDAMRTTLDGFQQLEAGKPN